jgi:hypothetical protein
MAAPRKLPPDGAAEDIQRLAAEGFSQLGIAAHFKVSRECFKRWIEEDEALNEAFELGRETERQVLHAMVVASARANKPANVNAFFLLKARHGYIEADHKNANVNVNVAVAQPVLIVKDFGTDEEWAAKALAQQRALTLDAAQVAPAPALPIDEPVSLAASVAPAYYGPPIFPWESQPMPVSANAPEAIQNTPATPPAPMCEAPAWRGNA